MGAYIKMTLATKLVSLRKQKGLTQMELAEKLNVSRQAISRWEVGAAVPSMENLKTLGKLYAVSVDYLLNDLMDECEDPEEIPKNNDKTCHILAGKGKKYILVLTVLILLASALFVFAKQFERIDEPEGRTPFGELDIDDANDSAETFETFSLGW